MSEAIDWISIDVELPERNKKFLLNVGWRYVQRIGCANEVEGMLDDGGFWVIDRVKPLKFMPEALREIFIAPFDYITHWKVREGE
jgi:hypothetical protein